MSAVVRSAIIAIIGLILAVMVGTKLGGDSPLFGIAVIGAALLLGAYKLFFKTIRIESLILGFLVFGYIVANRGFAQLTLAPNTPMYVGEVGMVACLAILGARLALKRERLIPK